MERPSSPPTVQDELDHSSRLIDIPSNKRKKVTILQARKVHTKFVHGWAQAVDALAEAELLCVDSGATHCLTNNRDDFCHYSPLEDTYIAVANGAYAQVHGIGTVLLRIGQHVVKEQNWYHVPDLTMRLLATRVHRRRQEGCCYIATHTDCLLGYPTFFETIDDTVDCVLPCIPALPTDPIDFDDSVPSSTTPKDPPKLVGQAFRSGSRVGGEFLPFDMQLNYAN